MLIGIDASRSTAAERTGTENYSLSLIRALLDLDHRNHYRLYFNQPPATRLFPEPSNAESKVMPFPRLWTHVRLMWEIARNPPDVLFVPAHVLPVAHPPRSVVTVHDLGYLYFPEAHTPLSRRYLDITTRYHARAATHLLADSEATKRDLVEHYGAGTDAVTVVYPGRGTEFAPVAFAKARSEVRDRYGIREEYILHLGSLQPRKNLERLLDAFAMLQERQDLHLVLAGKKGWLYEPLFKHVRESGLEARVRFVGYVPQADLPALISGARLLAFPSLYEGFGFPVLEAMACGTPVVCSNTSSLPEVAGDAALLVDPTNARDLAHAISRVLEDGALAQELAQKGLRRANQFSWERCAAQSLAVLERAGRSL